MATQAQNHIHIDVDLSGAPENAPVNTYTALTPEIKKSRAFVALEFAVDGTAMVHRVTSGGSTVATYSRRYKLKVSRAEEAQLVADEGELVSFVENYHCDNNEDHTAFIETAILLIVDTQSREHADLASYYMTVELLAIE